MLYTVKHFTKFTSIYSSNVNKCYIHYTNHRDITQTFKPEKSESLIFAIDPIPIPTDIT